jgi:hypothetical protein
MQSVRCFGETKFFRQCPRYILAPRETLDPCFCWEHKDQRTVRLQEVEVQRTAGAQSEWAPLGAFITNQDVVAPIPILSRGRLRELADDDQNVHTAEVQLGVNGAIRRLQAWAIEANIKAERDLPAKVASTIMSTLPDDIEQAALEHLRHCYQWNDDTKMFGTTYPQLATWVWARVDREHENRDLLRERFFEEVAESAGQCLNGNMARLMNVFSAIDLEMSPQEVCLSGEQLQNLAARAVQQASSLDDALLEIRDLLLRANVAECDWEGWLQSTRDAFE